MQRESHNDIIDRVAAALTDVAGAESLAPRVHTRLQRTAEPLFWRTSAAAAAAAAVAIVLAVMWSTTQPTPVERPEPQLLMQGDTVRTFIPLTGAIQARALVSPSARVAPAHATVPGPLTIEPLTVEALSEVEPLFVEEIRIAGITGEDMRGPK
jgi:hypothetical protein